MNKRQHSELCIIFGSAVAAVNGQIGVSGLSSEEPVVQSAALMLWQPTFGYSSAGGMRRNEVRLERL